MKRELLIAFSAASLMGGVAFAAPPSSMSQGTQIPAAHNDAAKADSLKSGSSHQAAMPTSPSAKNNSAETDASNGGLTMAKTATMAVRFTSRKPAELITSNLIGADVYNNQNEYLGEIKDFEIENGRTLSGVVVNVGGVLGIGGSYVLIDPSTVVLDRQDGTLKAFVDTSKENLKSAPKFTYDKASS